MDALKLPYEHDLTHEWRIKKADLAALNPSKFESLQSPLYFASKSAGVRYCFFFCPYGNTEDYKDSAWISLQIEFGHVKEVVVKCTVSIDSAKFCGTIEDILKDSTEIGVHICKSPQLFDSENAYFVDDELVVKFSGILKFDRPLISNSYPVSLKWTFKAKELPPKNLGMLMYHNGRPRIANCVTNQSGLESKKFDIPNSNIKYFLKIYPNGDHFKNIGKALVFFCLESERKIETEANMTLSVNSGIYSENLVYEESGSFGVQICSNDDLFDSSKGFIVNEEMCIKLEGSLLIREKKIPKFALLGRGINHQTLNAEKNFKIVVGQKEIKVNKEFLISVSSVFARMFESGMKETTENQMEIADCSFITVNAAMNILYGISPAVTIDDMLPLLKFADKYDIQLIKELVEAYLIKNIAPSNVCQLIHFSTLFNAPELYKKSSEFFVQCSKDSVAVNDLDLIGKETFYKLFSQTFGPLCC